MAIGPSFYNEADQKLYSEGSLFLPQEQYRLSLGNNNQVNKLDFSNLSNSGIMSQAPAPYIYPPINQGGGGGDGPPTGPAVDNSQFDYEFDALGGVPNSDNVGLTEEEQEDLDNVKSANVGLTGAMKAAFALNTLGPFAAMHSLSKSQKKAEDAAIEAATYGKAHRYDGRSNEYGTHTSTMTNAQAQANQDRGRGNTGNTGGFSSSERGAAMHGADGGRVGYFFGGRVNYKSGGRVSFKNGGLAGLL